MDDNDLIARVQHAGRLHGRNEGRRVACAVLTVLSEMLPARSYRRLIAPLPDDFRHRLPMPSAGSVVHVLDCRAFLARIADRLQADGPDAAFLARVVLGQLNATGWRVTPAALAHLVPADLRPIFRTRSGGTLGEPVRFRAL